MHPAQRVGAVAATPADGVRAGRQDAEDADSGLQRRGHLALLQGNGAILHARIPVGATAPHRG